VLLLLVLFVVEDGKPVLFDPVAGMVVPVPVVGLVGVAPVAWAKPKEEKKAKSKDIVNTRTTG